jgi:CheY-like chemotaxis protein
VRVLVVEDDVDICEAMRQMLEWEGYDVSCAGNGREALEALRSSAANASLILLDLRMPVMDGYAFRAAQLQDARLSDIPVVVVTADLRAGDGSSSLRADAVLRKPVDPERLLDLVRSYAAA